VETCREMGSLVAGWKSPTSGSGKGRFERNKSLTNEEIETFWKVKNKVAQEEHLKTVAEANVNVTSDIQIPTDDNITESEAAAALLKGAIHQKLAANRPVGVDTSRSFPGCDATDYSPDSQFGSDGLDSLGNTEAWWTRSSLAFLNEPPLMAMEGPAHNYATQHHVSAPGCNQHHVSAPGEALI